jgi:DNA-binding NtrC family response regulator
MHEPTSVNRKDILVVDDVPAIRELLSNFLENRGYRIKTAATVCDAQHLLDKTRFSLVITNLQLDRTLAASGCEVVKHAKSSSPPIPVIVITGGATSETAARIARLGAEALLPKPIALEHLHRLVHELLSHCCSA